MNLRRIRLLIWKEFKQLRRDPMFARMILAMPVVQLILFGYVIGADVTHLPTAVVDLDRTEISRTIGRPSRRPTTSRSSPGPTARTPSARSSTGTRWRSPS